MLYRARARTTLAPTAANGVLCAFRPGARPADILEVRCILRNTPALSAAPTAGFAIGIARSSALGTGALTQQLGVTLKSTAGQEASTGGIVTAWATTAPTPGTILDSQIGGTQIGYPIVFAWDRLSLLELPDNTDATAELCLILSEAHGTAPLLDVIVTWDE